jgi:transcriptional regulator with AAA-type ATPase domain
MDMETNKSQNLDHLFDFSAPIMGQAMDKLARAADTNASILILGECGTGKSVLARIAHQLSSISGSTSCRSSTFTTPSDSRATPSAQASSKAACS